MTRARNYKSHLEAQRWKDYNAGNLEKSFTEEFTPPEDSNLRRSARVKKNQERIFSASDFDSVYFGSVPPYVSLEEKERIDKSFLTVKDSSDSEDVFENGMNQSPDVSSPVSATAVEVAELPGISFTQVGAPVPLLLKT